jgi:hypothetical protein
MITKLKNYKTSSYMELKELILSPNFSWNYYGPTVENQNKSKDFRLLAHPFLARPGIHYPYPKPSSPYTDLATYVCQEILGMNKIEIHLFYRISVNMILDNDGTSPKHVDHPFPHSNLIVYINKFDNGRTLLYDGEEEHSLKSEEDMAITFDGNITHCHEASSSERRIALVATYLKNYDH